MGGWTLDALVGAALSRFPDGPLGSPPMSTDSFIPPSDPYWKLRPAPSTPEDEVCHCVNLKAVMLRDALNTNPIHCVACNGEVLPERIGFDWRLAEDIASWRSIYQSLYRLWLDSSEYEMWAAEKLSDPNGRVNVAGRNIVEALNQHIRTYYWWFENTDREDHVPALRCPICGDSLTEVDNRDYRKCESCSVMV